MPKCHVSSVVQKTEYMAQQDQQGAAPDSDRLSSLSFLSVSFTSQESSWSSALPSLLRVCITCCGPVPTSCSQHPFGAAKCRGVCGPIPSSQQAHYWPVRVNWGFQTAAAPHCHGGSKLNTLTHHWRPLAVFTLYFDVTTLRQTGVNTEGWEGRFNVGMDECFHADPMYSLVWCFVAFSLKPGSWVACSKNFRRHSQKVYLSLCNLPNTVLT